MSCMSVRCSGRSFLPALLLAGLLIQPVLAQSSQLENKSAAEASPAAVPVVIELFTSEGCSSCPPADGILQRLDEFQPIPGAQLIVLSEHVTYWDQDGWKDPNSSPVFTDRQNAYEPLLKEKEPFTPQFVIDGAHEVLINKVQEMEAIINQEKSSPKVGVRVGEIAIDQGNPGQVKTHVEADANSGKKNADVFVAVALDHVESQVLRGENGGKHLIHVAVVQDLTKVGKLPKGKSFAQDVTLKLKPGVDPKNVRVIAFVQESGPGVLLGAAMRKSANESK